MVPILDEAQIAELVARPALSRGRGEDDRFGGLGGGLGGGDGGVLGGRDGGGARVRPLAAIGITDDYDYWSAHACKPWAGKPFWLTLDDESTLQVFAACCYY
ncbi:hypothetical protein T492DRAFT_841154 [Pavlovales sp. CCMP2436]|nr:hypothetical protein T492DRAFT_841154 [Pavlovales sp. CCMP2436]